MLFRSLERPVDERTRDRDALLLTTEIYTLSLHDALPSSSIRAAIASLSATDRLRPSCWDPSRSVVSKTWNSAGFGLEVESIEFPRIVGGGQRKNLPSGDREAEAR